jgi:hypothetical protein
MAGHVDLHLLEPSPQMRLEVGDPGPVLRGVLDIDGQRVQPVVVAVPARGPTAQSRIGPEGERAEAVDDLGQRLGKQRGQASATNRPSLNSAGSRIS